jgi:2-dehydropantoate 2-reductase
VRVGIFAAGAVGGYLGARLVQAGHDVAFIARGAHLEAIREQGLRVDSRDGDLVAHPARATDDPREVGEVESVLVAVKAWQLPEAARAMRPMVGAETTVLPLLNGVEAPDVLGEALGRERVLGGLSRLFVHLEGPGHVVHTGTPPRVELGELDGSRTPRAEAVAGVLGSCRGVTASVSPDIRSAMWIKLAFISSAGGVGAVSRSPHGVFRAIPETRALLERAIADVERLGRARGLDLPRGLPGVILAAIDALPPESITSMHRDLAAGRPSELEAQVGAVVRLGREAGVPTPAQDFLYAALLPQERAARGEAPAAS